jgi:uncharacterized protein
MNHDQAYGVGLAYRTMIHDKILGLSGELDLLEISTEDYLIRQRRIWADPERRLLRAVTGRFPCVAHGIGLSLGTVEPLERRRIDGTVEFLRETGIPTFSEHLAFHRVGGQDLSVFLCMPFDEAAAGWVAENYRAVRSAIGRPFALENVSYYFSVPGGQFDEPGFLCEVLKRIDGSLLLDVTNVYNNCVNHNQDPYEYIRRLPGDRISQMHLAGGHYEDGFLIDSHSYPVMEEVWALYEEALKHTSADIVILERDENIEPLGSVLDDIRRARSLFYRHRPKSKPRRHEEAVPAGDGASTAYRADPFAPQFANLRNFQRALFRKITGDGFRGPDGGEFASILRDCPMDEDWARRLQACSPDQVEKMAMRWKWFESEDRRAEEEYRRIEWQEWARQLGV